MVEGRIAVVVEAVKGGGVGVGPVGLEAREARSAWARERL